MPPYDVTVPDVVHAAAVLLHPHPDYGGDRHNVVVSALFRGLPAEGVAVLRFDFGSSDPGAAAAEAVAAVDHLAAAVPATPLVLAGYSFGADVASTVVDERVTGWFLAAPPFRFTQPAIARDPRPKAVLAPERDQFSLPERAAAITSGWAATTVETLPGCDHFLVGCTDRVVAAAISFLGSLAPGGVGITG